MDRVVVGNVGQGKRAKYYRLTRAGRKQLGAEQSKWEQLSIAIARVLRLPDTQI
jgi:DNA-binding PadR family transcriptional regulator